MNKFAIKDLVRENISKLLPYSCARDEYKGERAVFLDANENPYENGYNRYPDPYQRKLKARISEIKGVPVERMMLGNGSDEIIDLMIRSFCEPKRDHILVFSPGYTMYEVSAEINDVEIRKMNLTTAFLPDWTELKKQTDPHSKILFLCTPNNPTGKVIPYTQLEQVCIDFPGIVIVDEAYIDFTDECSAVKLLEKYRNVVVLQTLSKAWGMAGLRLGICFADPEVIQVLNKVKAPYNISSLTQQAAVEVLQRYEDFQQKCLAIKTERQRLVKALRALEIFQQVYDSEANFILGISDRCREVYHYLVDRQIVVRLRDIPPLIAGGIRITVGTKEENDCLLDALSKMNQQVTPDRDIC